VDAVPAVEAVPASSLELQPEMIINAVIIIEANPTDLLRLFGFLLISILNDFF
jgi:hypothetical protein